MFGDPPHQRQRLHRSGHDQFLPRAQPQTNLHRYFGQPVQLLFKRQIRKLRCVATSIVLIAVPRLMQTYICV